MKILKTILFSMGAVQAIDMDALIAALKSNDTDALEKFNNQKVILIKIEILHQKTTKNLAAIFKLNSMEKQYHKRPLKEFLSKEAL